MKTVDTDKLWSDYQKKPTPEIREQLILAYAQLVKLVAGRLSMYLGHNVEYDDLVSYGIFGLIDAIDKFDMDKNVKFETEEADGITYLKWDFKVYGIKKTVGNYIKQTFSTTTSYCVIIWRSLLDLLSGKYGISAISGPVGMTVTIAYAARQNFMDLLPMMALITVNLGIFNLLPLPALDGGRLVFILFEMIFRRKVPEKYENVIHTVGFMVLIGIMLLVTFKDIIGLF